MKIITFPIISGTRFLCCLFSFGNIMSFSIFWSSVFYPIFEMRPLGREDPQEKGMATHLSILAWRIPWTEELGELQSMGLQRVRYD